MAVSYDRLSNLCGSHPYAIVSRTLTLNDLIGTVPNRVVDFLLLFIKVFVSFHACKLFQAYPINIRTTPYSQFAVPVLTRDKRMHISAVYIQFLTDQIFQPCSIQHCPGTDNPLLGET